jgi:hypothetical protein
MVDVTSPRGATRKDCSQAFSAIPRARKRLRFMGLQQIPETAVEAIKEDPVATGPPPGPEPPPGQEPVGTWK